MTHNKINILKIRHFGIHVLNLEQSLRLYRDILGMSVYQFYEEGSDYINELYYGLKETNCSYKIAKLKANDGTVIELIQEIDNDFPKHTNERENRFNQHNPAEIGLGHIAIEVIDIEQTHEKLIKIGLKPFTKPLLSTEGNAKVFFCYDYNGMRLEFVEII